MRFGSGPDAIVREVRWYFTDRPFLNTPTVYHSRNWDAEHDGVDRGGPGEVIGTKRSWVNGVAPANECQGAKGTAEQWSGTDLTPLYHTPAWDAEAAAIPLRLGCQSAESHGGSSSSDCLLTVAVASVESHGGESFDVVGFALVTLSSEIVTSIETAAVLIAFGCPEHVPVTQDVRLVFAVSEVSTPVTGDDVRFVFAVSEVSASVVGDSIGFAFRVTDS